MGKKYELISLYVHPGDIHTPPPSPNHASRAISRTERMTTEELFVRISYALEGDYPRIRTHGLPIHEGYTYNGGSIPRFLWWFAHPFHGWMDTPACIHDYLGEFEMFNAKFRDDVFYVLLKRHGANPFKAWACYKSVRWFGWIHRWWVKRRANKG